MHKERWGFLLLIPILAAALVWALHTDDVRNARLRIGTTYMTMNNPFYSVIDEELRLMIESRGDILLTRDPALSQERQNEQIRDLLREHVDLLVVNPVDFLGVTPALEDAQAAGVPVVVVDSQVSDPTLARCTIVSDNYNAGVLCAKHLQSTRGSGRIILLEHPRAQSAVDRIAGFCDTLAGNENYEIIGRKDCAGQLELAMPALGELLKEGCRPDIVMALNDPSAMGAMAALEEYGLLTDVSVYGVDGAPEAKSMIAEGVMTATVAQSPIQIGQATAQVAYQILSGEPCQREIIVPVTLLTFETIGSAALEGWQ